MLEHSPVSQPEFLESHEEGTTGHGRVRFRYTGPLPPGAHIYVDPRRLSFVLAFTYDLDTLDGTWTIHPDYPNSKLEASGTSSLRADGDGCLRTLAGNLRIKIPLVGSRVEKAIIDGMRDHNREEAKLIAEWVQRPG